MAAPGRWAPLSQKARLFWPLVLSLFVADCATKRAAERSLSVGAPQPVVGEVVRFTLSYNREAAMGLGPDSRIVLVSLSLTALLALALIYRRTPSADRRRAVGVALVMGGALGNLLDRLRSSSGVVDFIDLGLGSVRFWTFNIADVGITAGAVLLMIVFGRWNREPRRGLSPAP